MDEMTIGAGFCISIMVHYLLSFLKALSRPKVFERYDR